MAGYDELIERWGKIRASMESSSVVDFYAVRKQIDETITALREQQEWKSKYRQLYSEYEQLGNSALSTMSLTRIKDYMAEMGYGWEQAYSELVEQQQSDPLPDEVTAMVTMLRARWESDAADLIERLWREKEKAIPAGHTNACKQRDVAMAALELIADYQPRGGKHHLLSKQARTELERIRGIR